MRAVRNRLVSAAAVLWIGCNDRPAGEAPDAGAAPPSAASTEASAAIASSAVTPEPPPEPKRTVTFTLGPTPGSFEQGPAFAHVIKKADGSMEIARIVVFDAGAKDKTCESLLKRRAPAGGGGYALEISGDRATDHYSEYGVDGGGTPITFGKPAELKGGYCVFKPKDPAAPQGRSTGACMFGAASESTAKLDVVGEDAIVGSITYRVAPELAEKLGDRAKSSIEGSFRAKTCVFERDAYVKRALERLLVSPADDKAIRELATKYLAAVEKSDGKAIDDLLESGSRGLIKHAQLAALYATEAEVRGLPSSEKILVLLMRVTLDADKLEHFTEGEIVVAMPPSAGVFVRDELRTIDRIEGDEEEAKMWTPAGEGVAISVPARREEGRFRLSPFTPALQYFAVADAMAKGGKGIPDDEIKRAFEKTLGRKVKLRYRPLKKRP